MHTLALVVVLAALDDTRQPLRPATPEPLPAAQSAAVDVIRTKDGQLHVGRIVDKVPTGYLFRSEQSGETYVIEYSNVDDVKSTAPAAPSAAALAGPGELTQQLIATTTADIKRLEEELNENGIVSPIVKMVVGVAGLAVAPGIAQLRGDNTVLFTLVLVGGAAFFITGIVQLFIRIGARARIGRELDEKRAYLEKLQAWGAAPIGAPPVPTAR